MYVAGYKSELCNALKYVSVSEDEYIVTPASSHKLFRIHVGNTLTWKTHVPNYEADSIYLTVLCT